MKESLGNEKRQITINDALGELNLIEQQIRMHPADSEPNYLQELRDDVASGKQTPEQVIERAMKIREELSSHYR